MSHKQNVAKLFHELASEVHSFIAASESGFPERWVPATYIKDQLGLAKNAYPLGNVTDNKTGWLFSTIARHLQEKDMVEYKKVGSRAFYKCK